jgi:hypothetical protein
MGVYDMVIGESVESVYAGSADPSHFDVYPGAASSKTGAYAADSEEVALYQRVADLSNGNERADQIATEALQQFPEEWLLLVDVLPHLHSSDIKQQVLAQLHRLKADDLAPLIDRALT